MIPADCTVKLGGEPWQIKFVTRRQMQRIGPKFGHSKKIWGLCVWDDRTIFVRRDLSLKNMVDTLIHEMRHAQHPVMFEAESFIDTTSTELADGLILSGLI